MIDIRNPAVWLIGFITLCVLFLLLRRRFGAAARERRRRKRSHRPVVSRKHGPNVKLAADVDKPKNNRKG